MLLISRTGSKLFDTLIVFLKDFFFEKYDFEKISSANDKIKTHKIPSIQRVKSTNCKVNLWLIVGD